MTDHPDPREIWLDREPCGDDPEGRDYNARDFDPGPALEGMFTKYTRADLAEGLEKALGDLLRHAGIADAHPHDKDGEDHMRESRARAALAAYRGETHE